MTFTFENEMKKLTNKLEESVADKQKIYVLRYNEYSLDGMFVTAWKKVSIRSDNLDQAKEIGNDHFKDNKNIKFRECICTSNDVGFNEFYGDVPVINVNQNGVNK
jgi:hypothetical protein